MRYRESKCFVVTCVRARGRPVETHSVDRTYSNGKESLRESCDSAGQLTARMEKLKLESGTWSSCVASPCVRLALTRRAAGDLTLRASVARETPLDARPADFDTHWKLQNERHKSRQ